MVTKKAKPRVGLEVLVTVVPQGGLPHLGKTNNLSTSGMLLAVPAALEVGARVELKLFLPGGGSKVDVVGEISRDAGATKEGNRYGVQFVDLPLDSEFEIEKFLASRLDRAIR